MTEPRKTTRSRAASEAAQTEQAASEAAASPPPPAPKPASAAPAAQKAAPTPPPSAPKTAPTPPPPPPAAPAPPPVAPTPPPSPMAAVAPEPPPATVPEGPPPGAQVAAAISGLATDLRTRLGPAELMLGAGALLVAGLSYLVFGFLFDARAPSELAVVSSVALLVLMGLERTQRQGFGTWYPVVLVILGAIVAVGAAYSFLNALRSGFAFQDLLDWLSLIAWWAGGVLAGIGAWMTYRSRA